MDSTVFKNHILKRLPANAKHKFLAKAKIQHFNPGDIIDSQHNELLFIESGVVAVLDGKPVATALEIMSLGNDGMIGVDSLVADTEQKVMVWATTGAAYVIAKTDFLILTEGFHDLKSTMTLYLSIYLNQLVRQTICARKHQLRARIANAILTTSDRCGNDYRLTQESLAKRLDFSRTSVNAAATELAANGCISYSRGKIVILNRELLEKLSCSCYEAFSSEKAKLQSKV